MRTPRDGYEFTFLSPGQDQKIQVDRQNGITLKRLTDALWKRDSGVQLENARVMWALEWLRVDLESAWMKAYGNGVVEDIRKDIQQKLGVLADTNPDSFDWANLAARVRYEYEPIEDYLMEALERKKLTPLVLRAASADLKTFNRNLIVDEQVVDAMQSVGGKLYDLLNLTEKVNNKDLKRVFTLYPSMVKNLQGTLGDAFEEFMKRYAAEMFGMYEKSLQKDQML